MVLSPYGKIFYPEHNGLVGLKESVPDFLGSDVLNMGAIGRKGPFGIIQIPTERDDQCSERNGTRNIFPLYDCRKPHDSSLSIGSFIRRKFDIHHPIPPSQDILWHMFGAQ